jgi:sugar phosphate isomerase/epimerase
MDVFSFIRRVKKLGLDGLQLNTVGNHYLGEFGHLGNADAGHLKAIRELIEEWGLYIEIDTRQSDISDLHRGLDICNALGADILRTYQIPENGTIDADKAVTVLKQAVPRCRDEGIRVAFENHEYQTAAETLQIVQRVDSEWIGVFCDTGNGMTVWEDPDVTVEILAPHAITNHFKDHVVIEENGLPVVATVPLGQGSMDLKKHFQILCKSSLKRINIEAVYAYRAPFRRSQDCGAGGKLGQGAFAIIPGPFAPCFIPPATFKVTSQVLESEDQLVEQSVKYVQQLREDYELSQ